MPGFAAWRGLRQQRHGEYEGDSMPGVWRTDCVSGAVQINGRLEDAGLRVLSVKCASNSISASDGDSAHCHPPHLRVSLNMEYLVVYEGWERTAMCMMANQHCKIAKLR